MFVKRVCIVVILFCTLCLGFITGEAINVLSKTDPGIQAVRLLYSFETPEDLVKQLAQLEPMLTKDVAEQLTMDDSRTVDVYYKFKYQRSSVKIEFVEGTTVYYRLINDNIDPDKLWVFDYELDADGKICKVEEFETKVCGIDG